MDIRHVDMLTCRYSGVCPVPKTGNSRLMRNRWRDADGIAVAKTCLIFLVAVPIIALLFVVVLAAFKLAWFG